MGRIRLSHYYTLFVEHLIRMAVRYETVSWGTPQYWFDFTKQWIDKQSEEDKEFIRFVFDKRFLCTTEGLCCFDIDGDLYLKRKRLANLEKEFAIEAGIADEYNGVNMGEIIINKLEKF